MCAKFEVQVQVKQTKIILVRLEFEIKLEPLLLPSAATAPPPTAPTAPTLF